MGVYTTDQWILFFFFYCLCGWVWESCYVSARQHHWVNRGFLHGPLLPIYGSGAIIILLATIRVQDSLPLIYLFGMIAATVLEYFTGAAMEGIFKVRYWDYSNQKLNLHGYICLSSTLAWGVFSILLVKIIHPPIAALLMKIPIAWTEPLAFILVAVTTVDAVQSTRAALDLREMLTKLTEENEDLRRLAKRAEVVSAFAAEDLQKFRDRTEVEKILLADRLEAGKAMAASGMAELKLRSQEMVSENLRLRTSAKLKALNSVADALHAYGEKLEGSCELTAQQILERKGELSEALERLKNEESRIRSRSEKSYQRALRILRGNPTASAKKYAEAMENLRKVGGLRHD